MLHVAPRSLGLTAVVPLIVCVASGALYAQPQLVVEAPAIEADAVPKKPYPCPDRPGDDKKEIVAARFLQAWICRTSNKWWNPFLLQDLPDTWKEPFPPLDLNGYGCYCGSGSTGLDTEPVDDYDECCRRHDIDWTAICQNTLDPTRPGLGCDCYTRIPNPTGCKDNKLTFDIPADPNDPEQPDRCAEQCANELNKQFDCYASVHEKTNVKPDVDKFRNQCNWEHDPNFVTRFGIGNAGPSDPFNLVPDYCKKSKRPTPASAFGPVEPGNNVYFACDCLLNRADCSGTETACARSAVACQKLGGSARASCYQEGGGCTPTVNLTDKECAYRDPNDPCPPPICDISLRPGEACDPVTGEAGEGGTCQIYGEDRFHCVRPAPVIDDVVVDASLACVAPATSAMGDAAPR